MPSEPFNLLVEFRRIVAGDCIADDIQRHQAVVTAIEQVLRARVPVADPDAATLRCRKCGDTYNVKFSYSAPVSPTASMCVKCGHNERLDREGYCKTQVSPPNYRDITYCGCNCKFEGDSNA